MFLQPLLLHLVLNWQLESMYFYRLMLLVHTFTAHVDFSVLNTGHLTILSDGTNIDTDDCVALIPSGHLVLSLNRQTYQELGLEGKPSFFSRSKPNRYGKIT
jgi:ribonuclease P/MRP protein subunit RPP40